MAKTSKYAASAQEADNGDMYSSILIFLMILPVLYLIFSAIFLLCPISKKNKEGKHMDIISDCISAARGWLSSKFKDDSSKKIENYPDNSLLNENEDEGKTAFNKAVKLIESKSNIFITGGAGTGKSYLLQQLKEQYPKLVLTSTTGVSAININGQTIHSWSGIGIANQSVASVVGKIIKNKVKYKQIAMCDMLAIDEISMLASSTMEYIDQVLREVRQNDAPFGGIQVILIGDFFQLPPVVTDKNGRVRKLQDSDYCFNCKTWKDLDLVPIVLKEVKRQTDHEFVKVLNNLREGKTELNDLRVIWTREEEVKDFVKSSDAADILKLFSTNENADNYNLKRLSELDYQEYPFSAEDKINWYDESEICLLSEDIDPESKEWQNFDKDCKAPLNLQLKCDLKLKKGCRVMLLHNLDVLNGLANGSCGTVVGIKPDEIDVLFDTTKDVVPIQRVEFAMPLNTVVKKFKIKDENGIEEEIELTRKSIVRKQFPLRLAYGITIHKSQGMTFDKLIVDCGKVFADGQAYVALSRTRSLQGLYPIHFDHTTVTVSSAVVEFYKQLDGISVVGDLTNTNLTDDGKEKLIRQAIKEGKKLKIKYHSNSLYKNEETVRTVVPQRLVYGVDLNKEDSENPYPFEDDTLYLKAFCEFRGEDRSFRVDNIRAIKIV